MNIFLLFLVIIGVSVQSISKKNYSIKNTDGDFTFITISILTAFLMFLCISGGRIEFCKELMPYEIAYAISYCAALIFSILAIKTGPLAISAFIYSCALIIPSLYGIIILDESVTIELVIGISLLLISLMFINLKKKEETEKISSKWIICVILSFVGNGACSTVQKVQQLAFEGCYKIELMIVALAISLIVMIVSSIVTEKGKILLNIKKAFPWALYCGLANGAVNLLVLHMLNKLPSSVMFPVISAGEIVLTTSVSVFAYKEMLGKKQLIGLVIGIISLVFLNL